MTFFCYFLVILPHIHRYNACWRKNRPAFFKKHQDGMGDSPEKKRHDFCTNVQEPADLYWELWTNSHESPWFPESLGPWYRNMTFSPVFNLDDFWKILAYCFISRYCTPECGEDDADSRVCSLWVVFYYVFMLPVSINDFYAITG